MNTDSANTNKLKDRAVWLLLVVLIAAAVAYLPALSGPFIFDDLESIPDNPHIRHLWPLSRALSAPEQTAAAGRPVVCLSLAVNFAIGELNVRGYHALNLAAHMLSALLLFAITRRTLHSPVFSDRYESPAGWLALVVTAIWALHPLQSEAVIYVIQRTELFMALFLLLTLYCASRSAASSRPWTWYVAAVAACALGMASKEVMVAAPLIVLLYDRTFLSTSFLAALRQRAGLYIGLAATWGVLAAVLVTGPRSNTIGFELGITALDYLRTQAGVIIWYLRLAFYPHPLVISYDDWPIVRSFGPAALPGITVLALLGASVWGLVRRHPAGFLGATFFLILAPTSSIVPIVTEVVAERRMYLPLIAPVLICVVVGYRLLSSASLKLRHLRWPAHVLVGVLVVACGYLTHARTNDYRTTLTIWQDTVAKRPRNALAHINLGNALFKEDRVTEAIQCYETAVNLDPSEALAHHNLANALVAEHRVRESLAYYENALRLKPRFADARFSLALAWSKLGNTAEEIKHLRAVLEIDPDHFGACNNLGIALAKTRQFEQALPYYRRALEIDPNSAIARRNLGDALLDLNRLNEAAAEYRQARALKPNDARTRGNLGITLAMQRRDDEAIAELREALRLDPNQPGVRHVLNDLLKQQNRRGP